MAKLWITGGLVVMPTGARQVDLQVEGGRITGLVEEVADRADGPRIDARGLVVLPGAIDGHTHFIQSDPQVAAPSPDEFEGFTNGGAGAAAGGVTTTIEMPQSDPPATTVGAFERKRELAEEDAVVDFALWGGIVPGQAEGELEAMVRAGAVGFKAYMCDSDETYPGVSDAILLDAARRLAGLGVVIGVHAENDSLLKAGIAAMQAAGRMDPLAHAESRPAIVEVEAVHRAIFFSRATGAAIHIVHMSSPGAAALVKKAKEEGVRVTCETCPQYLVLDTSDLVRLGGFAKCAPAVRTATEVSGLWNYVADGTIDVIASDHCAYTVESKRRGMSDIFAAPNGLSGIQTMVPLMISEGRARGLSWTGIAALLATNPATLWGLRPRKGAIQVGADADLTFVDPSREWVVQSGDLLHTQKWTPYEGMKLSGRIVRTLVRGEEVYALQEEGVCSVGAKGRGIFVRRVGYGE